MNDDVPHHQAGLQGCHVNFERLTEDHLSRPYNDFMASHSTTCVCASETNQYLLNMATGATFV
jgi:hypothetical protein